MSYIITKWCKSITDDGQDKVINKKPANMEYKFRLLDSDGIIYAYGYSDDNSSFDPLDDYIEVYGCTEIQYKNKLTGVWETL